MSAEPAEPAGEVRLDPESIEALAQRLAELLAPRRHRAPRGELISAEEVARWWGVGRRWVYDHADELGRTPPRRRPAGRACASIPMRSPSASASRWASGAGCAAIGGDARRLRIRLAFPAEQSYRRSASKKTAGAAR